MIGYLLEKALLKYNIIVFFIFFYSYFVQNPLQVSNILFGGNSGMKEEYFVTLIFYFYFIGEHF